MEKVTKPVIIVMKDGTLRFDDMPTSPVYHFKWDEDWKQKDGFGWCVVTLEKEP